MLAFLVIQHPISRRPTRVGPFDVATGRGGFDRTSINKGRLRFSFYNSIDSPALSAFPFVGARDSTKALPS